MTPWLYHTYPSLVTIQLDDHWFRIPPNEPFEVDNDSNGRKLTNPEFYAHNILQQHGGIYGIIQIRSEKTRTGIVLDLERASEEAAAALLLNRHRHINLWAQEQLKTRVNKNLPVMAPTGFVEESIKELNIDLEATYRIRPVGWDFKPDAPSSANPSLLGPPVGADNGEKIAVLEAELAELRRLFTAALTLPAPSPVPPPTEKASHKPAARS